MQTIKCKQRDSQYCKEFAVRQCVGGGEEYMCRVCTQVRRQENWSTSRHFLRTHLASKEHLQNVRDLQEFHESRLRVEAESTREAAESRRLNVLDIPFAREQAKRPRIDDYDLQQTGQPSNDYLDDYTFSAGQDVLENIHRFHVTRDPARSLQHGIVDKFGLEADEADITASSVVGILHANGEHRISIVETKLTYMP